MNRENEERKKNSRARRCRYKYRTPMEGSSRMISQSLVDSRSKCRERERERERESKRFHGLREGRLKSDK